MMSVPESFNDQSAHSPKNDNEMLEEFRNWSVNRDAQGAALDPEKSDWLGLRRGWIDMAGDHAGGTMLAQIAYWSLTLSKDGKSKLRIHAHKTWWIAKSYKEWWEECRLSRSQVARLIQKFEKKGWIKTKIMRFNGSPTMHIAVKGAFLVALLEAVENPKSASGS